MTGRKGWNHERQEGKDEWLTPPEILEALGRFDLDPCSPICRPWDTAAEHYTIEDDGLSKQWHGRVWLNPPYGQETGEWLGAMARHGNGVALIFARTDTRKFQELVFRTADAVCFLEGRISFYRVDGTQAGPAGAPSCLVAYGEDNAAAVRGAGFAGTFLDLRVVRQKRAL